MNNRLVSALVFILLAAAIAVGGYFVWKQTMVLRLPKSTPAQEAAAPPAAQPVLPAPAASGPAIQYPIEAASAPKELPALAGSDNYFLSALNELLKRQDVLTFLQQGGFAARVVATVDNLARPHAAPMLWPVAPTPGRFTTAAASGGAESIAAANAARYTPFVRFIESIDSAQAVSLYARSYPLFQQAYEELGYPRRYFNDRLVAVIDHLLATPTISTLPKVKLTEIKGPMEAARPWVRYEFTDPQLESLSSGQKMLVRSGPDNQARLKAKLRDVRQRLTGAPLASQATAPASAARP